MKTRARRGGSPIEGDDGDESGAQSSNDQGLPPIVVDRGGHQNVQLLSSLIDRYLVMYDIPIDLMGGLDFTQVDPCRLFEEFGLGSMSRLIVERDEHHSGEVDDLGVDLEDSGRGLNLSFKAVGGGAEPAHTCQLPGCSALSSSHHQSTSKFEEKLLSCQYSSDMLHDLQKEVSLDDIQSAPS